VLSLRRVEELYLLNLSLTSIDTKNSLQQTQKPFVPLKEFAIMDFAIKIFVQRCTFTNQFQTKEAHPFHTSLKFIPYLNPTRL
jgi:hypothetical protein